MPRDLGTEGASLLWIEAGHKRSRRLRFQQQYFFVVCTLAELDRETLLPSRQDVDTHSNVPKFVEDWVQRIWPPDAIYRTFLPPKL